MRRTFHPLLHLIASATDSLLARYVRYLKEENRILRARIPGQIHTTAAERARLLKFGRPLGKAINTLITIVIPGTFWRWIRNEGKPKKKPKGRPRKSEVLRELVLRIAKEAGYGYRKILGELRRLGITRICRQTVASIIKEQGNEPSPKRSRQTWSEFLKSHAETLWACDFFTQRVATRRGLQHLYVLVFIHLDTRKIFVSPSTKNPDSAWVTEQTNAFIAQLSEAEKQRFYLIHDRDAKFSKEFRDVIRAVNGKPIKLPIRSPNLNARCERVIQTIRNECLRRFIVFGKRHLDYLITEFVTYYNEFRAHSSRDYLTPTAAAPPPENNTISLEEIVYREHLGGLLKTYERRAA